MGMREWTVLGLLLASFLGGAALAGGDGGQFPWFLSRAPGIAAFVALSASIVLGLMVTTKAAEPKVPRAFSFEIHGFLSMLSLTLVGVHGGALLFDSWFQFTPLHLVVPLIAPYAALWTGLGVVAMWRMAIVSGSFWMTRRIGYRNWRRLHYVSFFVHIVSFVHGVTAGTDTAAPLVYGMYALSGTTVAMLFVLRLTLSRSQPPARRATPPRRPVTAP